MIQQISHSPHTYLGDYNLLEEIAELQYGLRLQEEHHGAQLFVVAEPLSTTTINVETP